MDVAGTSRAASRSATIPGGIVEQAEPTGEPASRRTGPRTRRRAAAMGVRDVLYRAYARRLSRQLDHTQIPRHVGVIIDGNRRWAKAYGEQASTGHRRGADKINELLLWCEEIDVEVVTIWLLSTDNLSRRPAESSSRSVDHRGTVARPCGQRRRWRIHPVGSLDLLPDLHRPAAQGGRRTNAAVDGIMVNIAVGYGGGARSPTPSARCSPARPAEDLDRGGRRDPRRRAHRRAPLHQGPARPRPGDPHVG